MKCRNDTAKYGRTQSEKNRTAILDNMAEEKAHDCVTFIVDKNSHKEKKYTGPRSRIMVECSRKGLLC